VPSRGHCRLDRRHKLALYACALEDPKHRRLGRNISGPTGQRNTIGKELRAAFRVVGRPSYLCNLGTHNVLVLIALSSSISTKCLSLPRSLLHLVSANWFAFAYLEDLEEGVGSVP
jgi:hypothetical protein